MLFQISYVFCVYHNIPQFLSNSHPNTTRHYLPTNSYIEYARPSCNIWKLNSEEIPTLSSKRDATSIAVAVVAEYAGMHHSCCQETQRTIFIFTQKAFNLEHKESKTCLFERHKVIRMGVITAPGLLKLIPR